MKKSKKVNSKLKVFMHASLALLLVLIGLGLIFASNHKYLKFEKKQEKTIVINEPSKPKPTKIYIPKIEKSLSVSGGKFENERWEITETGVSYLTSSSLPGEKGNSVYVCAPMKIIIPVASFKGVILVITF